MRLVIMLIIALLFTPLLSSAQEPSENVCLFSVPRSFVTLPDLSFDRVKESVFGVVKATPDKLNTLTESLAEKLEATKKIAADSDDSSSATSTVEVEGKPGSTLSNMTATAYNTGVDIATFLLRHWLWTLSGLAALALFWGFKT